MFIVQNEFRPARMQNALSDLMREGLRSVRVCCAYMSVSGSAILFDSIVRAAPGGQPDEVEKVIVTSLDYGLTEPAALEFWRAKNNCTVLVAGVEQLSRGTLIPQVAFHPKFYIIGKPDGGLATLVGSANLTNRGLSSNAEVGWAEMTHPQPEPVERAWADAIESAQPLTTEILNAYAELRHRMPARPPAPELEPLPAPNLGPLSTYPPFAAATIDPGAHEEMWIQSRGLQGGANTQLELPRGSHRFFGVAYDDYEFERVEHIAEPVLVSGRREWPGRPLTWHGDNAMERINLPSVTMGGFAYENSMILFRRLGANRFELRVYPWESDSARALLEASRRGSLLFRVGRNSNRLAGVIP